MQHNYLSKYLYGPSNKVCNNSTKYAHSNAKCTLRTWCCVGGTGRYSGGVVSYGGGIGLYRGCISSTSDQIQKITGTSTAKKEEGAVTD